MQNTIKNLWYGNVTPLENTKLSNNLIKLYDKLSALESEVKPKIGKKWDDIDDIFSDIISEYQVDAFIQGFSLGAKLIFEIHQNIDE